MARLLLQGSAVRLLFRAFKLCLRVSLRSYSSVHLLICHLHDSLGNGIQVFRKLACIQVGMQNLVLEVDFKSPFTGKVLNFTCLSIVNEIFVWGWKFLLRKLHSVIMGKLIWELSIPQKPEFLLVDLDFWQIVGAKSFFLEQSVLLGYLPLNLVDLSS